MSAPVVEEWLISRINACFMNHSLKPVEHTLMAGKPLSSQKGQAEAFFLIDDNGLWWILKKFHNNCGLELKYMKQVTRVLPGDAGFACGKHRDILERNSLDNIRGYYYSRELNDWLNGTILMPRIRGCDWASLADDLRESKVVLDFSQRAALARQLAELAETLEKHQCSHRDLSCGNVYIDMDSWQVSLIDFDSVYHPSIKMPSKTTCGTSGYTCHLAWNGSSLDPANTWCEYADRYALAILIAEIILIDSSSGMTGEGGIFNQDELQRQSGRGITEIPWCKNIHISLKL
jgi:serine/threonine protein kinase